MATVRINIGKAIAIADDEDNEMLANYAWRLHTDGYAVSNFYEPRDARKKMSHDNRVNRIVRMHRIVMGAQRGQEVDHINGDRLDNRRGNLRIVTSSQNKMNSAIRKDNRTGHKGVFYERTRGQWLAYVKVSGKCIFRRRFRTKQQAIEARKEAEKAIHGAYARGA